MHSETGTTPAQRYHAEGRDRPPTPDPALLRRAFLWREQRKVTAFATVSLHGNRYEVDAALVGRTVDLLFTPFDLTDIDPIGDQQEQDDQQEQEGAENA